MELSKLQKKWVMYRIWRSVGLAFQFFKEPHINQNAARLMASENMWHWWYISRHLQFLCNLICFCLLSNSFYWKLWTAKSTWIEPCVFNISVATKFWCLKSVKQRFHRNVVNAWVCIRTLIESSCYQWDRHWNFRHNYWTRSIKDWNNFVSTVAIQQ